MQHLEGKVAFITGGAAGSRKDPGSIQGLIITHWVLRLPSTELRNILTIFQSIGKEQEFFMIPNGIDAGGTG